VSDRVLIRQVNWLGDLVMTTPATRAIRSAFPGASLTVQVKHELAGFYDGADWIDEVLPFRRRSGLAGIVDGWKLFGDLRQRRFDVAVIFPRSFSSALWPALARIPRRIGYVADGRGFLLTDGQDYSGDFLKLHQVNDHLELVRRSLGASGDPSDLVLPVDAANRTRMMKWLGARRQREGPLVAMAVAAAYGPAKEWPAERYAALIDRFASLHGAEAVLVGSPGERARCEEVASASRAGALVAAGRTSVGELLALLSLCEGFVGNDSGAMHVAAALGVPTVGIFGSTRPWRTGPLGPATAVVQHPIDCSPCLQRECRFGHYDCLSSISVESVEEALWGLMNRSPSP
jgi:heptosyltransferase-2